MYIIYNNIFKNNNNKVNIMIFLFFKYLYNSWHITIMATTFKTERIYISFVSSN